METVKPSPDPETRALERYLRRPTRRRLAAVVRACEKHVWNVALRLAGHEEDAADLCQDVFLSLLDRPPPAGSVRSARGWLAARLATVARDRRRSAERRARRESLGAQRIAEDERLGADEVEAVRKAVEELPDRLRAVVELRYFAGLTNREVAEAVGVAEPTVDKDLQRARQVLRRRLGKLAGALSVLAAAPAASVSAAGVPPAIAARWLQLVDWSPALFPHGATAILEAIIVKKAIAAAAALLLVAVLVGYVASPSRRDPPRGGVALEAVAPEPSLPEAPAPDPAASTVAVERPPAPVAPPQPAGDPAAGAATDGSLRLKVLWASDGTPAAGIGVEVWPRWCDSPLLCGRGGVTGDDGVLALDRLAPGRFSVRTSVGGRIDRRGALADFDVAAGEETPLLLRVDDRNTVRGIVVDASDRPVGGAAIWLSADAFDAVGGNVVAESGPDGAFEIRGAGDHGLFLSARAPGYAPSSQLVVKRRPDEVVRLVLPSAGGAVRGRVLGPDGRPVPRAWVMAGAREFTRSHVAPPPPARARTAEDGAFAVEGVAPGRVPVLVRAPPFAPREEAVDVAAGRASDVVIRLEAGALLGGSVTSADGRPIARAHVRLGDHDMDAYSSDLGLLAARTRDDGSFAIEGAPAGEHVVHIDAGDRGREKRTVVLAAGEETRLDVTLAAPLRFAGRLRYSDGTPLARAMLVIRPGGRTEITDGDGRFAFEGLEDRDYALEIFEPRAQIPAARREGVRPGPREIEIVVADDERASGSIAGTVVDPDGRAVRGAQVGAESVDSPGEAERVTSGFQGGFELERLPPATYRVRIDAEGHPRTWAGVVRVEHGRRVDLGTVAIPRPGFLAASVTRLDGGPKEAVYYGVIDADGRSALAVMLSSEPLRRDPVAPGKYRVVVRVPEMAEVSRDVEIEAGKETRVDLEVGGP
jgi:RNA polymerase sigma-70 factor (ECF subfamily)